MSSSDIGQCGVEFIRVLTQEEQRLLCETFATCKPLLRKSAEIYWLNLYLNREKRVDYPTQARLHEWVMNAARDFYSSWNEVFVLSYGFLINSASSTKDQKFHCDYTNTSSNLFVPLTPMTHLNAFQFLRAPLRKSRMDSLCNFGEEGDIMVAEGVDFLEITQVTCRPFSLLRLLPNTPHRGVTNRGDYDRVLFWVTVDDHYHKLQETTYFKEVLDETVFDDFDAAKDEIGDGTALVKRGEP